MTPNTYEEKRQRRIKAQRSYAYHEAANRIAYARQCLQPYDRVMADCLLDIAHDLRAKGEEALTADGRPMEGHEPGDS